MEQGPQICILNKASQVIPLKYEDQLSTEVTFCLLCVFSKEQ